MLVLIFHHSTSNLSRTNVNIPGTSINFISFITILFFQREKYVLKTGKGQLANLDRLTSIALIWAPLTLIQVLI